MGRWVDPTAKWVGNANANWKICPTSFSFFSLVKHSSGEKIENTTKNGMQATKNALGRICSEGGNTVKSIVILSHDFTSRPWRKVSLFSGVDLARILILWIFCVPCVWEFVSFRTSCNRWRTTRTARCDGISATGRLVDGFRVFYPRVESNCVLCLRVVSNVAPVAVAAVPDRDGWSLKMASPPTRPQLQPN